MFLRRLNPDICLTQPLSRHGFLGEEGSVPDTSPALGVTLAPSRPCGQLDAKPLGGFIGSIEPGLLGDPPCCHCWGISRHIVVLAA